MKTKQKTRALVVETRNREVAGGSLWAGRLLRQALSLFWPMAERGIKMEDRAALRKVQQKLLDIVKRGKFSREPETDPEAIELLNEICALPKNDQELLRTILKCSICENQYSGCIDCEVLKKAMA